MKAQGLEISEDNVQTCYHGVQPRTASKFWQSLAWPPPKKDRYDASGGGIDVRQSQDMIANKKHT
jgi:hypothetical protein